MRMFPSQCDFIPIWISLNNSYILITLQSIFNFPIQLHILNEMLHPETSGSSLNVQMEIHNEWYPSGVHIGASTV